MSTSAISWTIFNFKQPYTIRLWTAIQIWITRLNFGLWNVVVLYSELMHPVRGSERMHECRLQQVSHYPVQHSDQLRSRCLQQLINHNQII